MALLEGRLRCESVNAALAEMVGCDAEALLGDGLAKRFADAGARLRGMTLARPKAKFAAGLLREDGSELAVTVRAMLEPGEDGGSYYALAMRST